ncbi:hypothetical protein EDD16DRAFT_1653475, partial [Pisolithus croceorrhizus]
MSIGIKEELRSTLEGITRIPTQVLNDEEVIMSWAANWKMTRIEDRAYSLLGLFGVSMSMLYGEGSKEFQ